MARLIKDNPDIGIYMAARKVLGPSAEKKSIDSLARCWKSYGRPYLNAEEERLLELSHISAQQYRALLATKFNPFTGNKASFAIQNSRLEWFAREAKIISEIQILKLYRNNVFEVILHIQQQQEKILEPFLRRPKGIDAMLSRSANMASKFKNNPSYEK